MRRVMISGATGYLGRYLCAEYRSRGYHVTALVRASARTGDLAADAIVTAEATEAKTLVGCMDGIDLVVSALGITRQTDGLGYWDVDYRGNLNLLEEAERSGVAQFAFVHEIGGQGRPSGSMRRILPRAARALFARHWVTDRHRYASRFIRFSSNRMTRLHIRIRFGTAGQAIEHARARAPEASTPQQSDSRKQGARTSEGVSRLSREG